MGIPTASTCLHCEKPAHSRGLCVTHYARYSRERRKLAAISEKLAEEFDQAAIDEGMILATEKSGPAPKNEFANLAKRLRTRKTKQEKDAASEQHGQSNMAAERREDYTAESNLERGADETRNE